MRRDYNTETNEPRRYSSSGVSDKLTYLLVGGGIGAVIALLFAPKSGTELRGDIADVSRKGLDRTREAAAQLRDHSGEYYQQIKEHAGDFYNRAGDAYTSAADKLRSRKLEDETADYIENTASELGDGIKETGKAARKQANSLT